MKFISLFAILSISIISYQVSASELGSLSILFPHLRPGFSYDNRCHSCHSCHVLLTKKVPWHFYLPKYMAPYLIYLTVKVPVNTEPTLESQLSSSELVAGPNSPLNEQSLL